MESRQPTSAIENQVKHLVDKGLDETVAFLSRLVGQPSTQGNELDAQQSVHNRPLDMGLPSEMWDLDIASMRSHPLFCSVDLAYRDRPNVTAHWKAQASGGHSLVLNGHIDVVPASSPELWTHDPWAGDIEGDWLYGRGAADMKGGIAAMLLAVQAIRSAGIELAGDLIVQSVIEEEQSGNGTLACPAAWAAS